MKVTVSDFAGIAPRLTPASLPPNAAQVASQARLYAGALQPINFPRLVAGQVASSAQSLYPLGPQSAQKILTWAADVDVSPSPLGDDEYKIYYSGDGEPKKTNLTLATGAGVMPASWYYLSVETPANAPSLAATAGAVPAGTYAYVYTYVTQFGATLLEESAPSAAGTITLGAPGGVTLTALTNAPGTANRNYVYKRIYRTTGSTYQMVAQIAAATTTYTDVLSATAIPADPLLTATYLPPKSDLKGFLTLAGGVIAAFRNNEIWFCEPGYPHAWPIGYMQTVDAPIVGAGVFGNTLVVGTTGATYSASGYHPSSFTFSKLPLWEPCVSKRSFASDENGVVYVSQNGLVRVGGTGIGVVTAAALSRATFEQYAPSTTSGCLYDGRYYGFYKLNGNPSGAFVFAPADGDKQITQIGTTARGARVDSYTARMLYINSGDNLIYEFDPADGVPYSYEWKSKRFQLPYGTSLGCVRVTTSAVFLEQDYFDDALSDYNTDVLAANALLLASGATRGSLSEDSLDVLELNGSVLRSVRTSVERTVGLRVWADNVLVVNVAAPPNSIVRIPSGFVARDWEVAVSGMIEIGEVVMATSPSEMT